MTFHFVGEVRNNKENCGRDGEAKEVVSMKADFRYNPG
jgi:hypothetical protein